MNLVQYGYSKPVFEAVHVELSWYDGPREGVAEILGVTQRFKSLFDEADDEWVGSFYIWPISKQSFALELEAWGIFVEWTKEYELGNVEANSHPGLAGVSARYSEIKNILKQEREDVPDNCARATVEFRRLERDNRYDTDGPDYSLRWKMLNAS